MKHGSRTRMVSALLVSGVITGLAAAPSPVRAEWSFAAVGYTLTTDFVRVARGDYEVEFSTILARKASWAVRIAFDKNLQASSTPYADGKRRWEVGFRWRYFPLGHSPHWLFIGFGWNNRPQDSQITPLGEAGFALHIKPLTAMVVGYYGYEIYIKDRPGFANKWRSGIEARAGFCI